MPPSWRIFPKKFEATPLGTGPGDSRFATKNGSFTVLYATPAFTTAFVETVVRDRFLRTEAREVYLVELTMSVCTLLTSQPSADLTLLDLRGDGTVRLGAPSDAVRASDHAAGRELGRSIYADHKDVDGILFASRLTGGDIYAVFDRAITAGLAAAPAAPLIRHPELEGVLERFAISLRKEE